MPHRGRVREAAVAFQQFHHRRVAGRQGAVHDRAAGVDLPVRVRATLEEHLRHRVLAQPGAVVQRHAPRVDDLLQTVQARPLVRIEAQVEEQLQHLGPIVPHGDRE